MDADEAMRIIQENRLTIKETFKLWRLLSSRVALISADVICDMQEREPELFRSELSDDKGRIYYPWHKGYSQLRESIDPNILVACPRKNGL